MYWLCNRHCKDAEIAGGGAGRCGGAGIHMLCRGPSLQHCSDRRTPCCTPLRCAAQAVMLMGCLGFEVVYIDIIGDLLVGEAAGGVAGWGWRLRAAGAWYALRGPALCAVRPLRHPRPWWLMAAARAALQSAAQRGTVGLARCRKGLNPGVGGKATSRGYPACLSASAAAACSEAAPRTSRLWGAKSADPNLPGPRPGPRQAARATRASSPACCRRTSGEPRWRTRRWHAALCDTYHQELLDTWCMVKDRMMRRAWPTLCTCSCRYGLQQHYIAAALTWSPSGVGHRKER